MRYKIVDNKRLNVYLTKTDLQKENVTIDEIVSGNENSVVKIKKIFKDISRLAEFNINNQSLNIVLMPIVDGDLIISAGFADKDYSKYERMVFEFDDFEELLEACYEVKKYNILSSLYKMDDKYYILLETDENFEKYSEKICMFFSEFGNKIDFCSYFIVEHGTKIIKKYAIEQLIGNFF